jgi:uncharacterized protein (DUF849 family)
MNYDVVITCAVTGAGDTTGRSDLVPVTPEEVARGHYRQERPRAGDP